MCLHPPQSRSLIFQHYKWRASSHSAQHKCKETLAVHAEVRAALSSLRPAPGGALWTREASGPPLHSLGSLLSRLRSVAGGACGSLCVTCRILPRSNFRCHLTPSAPSVHAGGTQFTTPETKGDGEASHTHTALKGLPRFCERRQRVRVLCRYLLPPAGRRA